MLKLFGRELSWPPKSAPALAKTVAREVPDAMETSLQALGRSRTAQVAPALLLATGAGAAFWWWTQWARGRAESEAAAAGEPKPPVET